MTVTRESTVAGASQHGRPTAGERISAVTAIVAVAAALVLAGLHIVLRFGAVLLALAGLTCCVTACWYAVSRRGAIRMIAVGAAIAGIGAVVAGLVLAVISVWILIAIVVLSVISVLSARHALRRTPKALRSRLRPDAGAEPAPGSAADTEPVPAPGPEPGPAHGGTARPGTAAVPAHGGTTRPGSPAVLIMNLKSGGGKAEHFGLADECRRRGIRPIVLGPGDDLARLAEDAIAAGAEVIGMAGGDGSQAIVAAVAARHQVPHVCVPAGTRNHFALDLGLDRADVVGALDAYSGAVERRIDLASVNGHPFVNNCSLGLYAAIVQSPQYRDAKLRTAADRLPELLGPDARPLDLRFSVPDGGSFDTAHLILVSNNPYQLAHPGGRGTRERLDGGVLGVVAVQVADAADARRFMLLELAGQVQRFDGWIEWTASRFEVGSGGQVEVGVDGEAMVLDPPLLFRSEPGALRVWLPKSALALSPAARAVRVMTRSTAADLVSVAAGSGIV